jgi:serine/threonine-protein kinase RsbW
MPETAHTIRLELPSVFEMIDLAQAVSDQLSRVLGLDEDAQHWINVAVRESVINAIKHGNRYDAAKPVEVVFSLAPGEAPTELTIQVRDHGEGFDPEDLPDPLAPENLLKSSGRGIFFMRSFMDDVRIERATGGGMQVRMVKRLVRPDRQPAQGSTSE